MSISLCMIARNEEEFIGNAIKSALNFVDEIIVIDTGSQDKTIEIAKSYNANIIKSKWRKDFSFHRNEAISMAKCDWILFLDCDEVIQDEGKNDIKNLLNNTNNHIKAYNLNIVNIISDTPIASFMSLRLFRNFEDFFFINPIHEQIIPSIQYKYGINCISNLPLTIHHYGYNDEVIRSKNKIERNLEILYSIEYKDGYIYAMIGDEYLKLNNLYEAIHFYEKSLGANLSFEGDYSPMLIINYITSLINVKRYNDAINFIDKVRKNISNFRDLYFLEFWILYYTNNFEKALIKLDEYINLLNSSSQFLEVKKFYNLYDLSDMRSKTISMIYNKH